MARIPEPITGINGVAPGGVATVSIPTGRRYHALCFKYKGNATQAVIEADILWIRLIVGGNMIREIIPAELNAELAANGIPFKAGRIPIFFSEPKRATVMEEEATSWDTWGQSTFEVQFGIADAATAPALTGYALYDYIRNDGLLVNGVQHPGANIVKWLRQSVVVAGAGDVDVKTLPKGIVQRMTIFGPISAPTKVQAKIGSRTIWDLERADAADVLSDYGITAQVKSYPVYYDFTQQIIGAQPIATADDYNVNITAADAQNFSVLSQVRVAAFV